MLHQYLQCNLIKEKQQNLFRKTIVWCYYVKQFIAEMQFLNGYLKTRARSIVAQLFPLWFRFHRRDATRCESFPVAPQLSLPLTNPSLLPFLFTPAHFRPRLECTHACLEERGCLSRQIPKPLTDIEREGNARPLRTTSWSAMSDSSIVYRRHMRNNCADI